VYQGHVGGWRAESFDAHLAPRSWELSFGPRRARLRLDAQGPGFVGHLKVYAQADGDPFGEQPGSDVEVRAWDGRRLEVVVHDGAATRLLEAEVSGRLLAGTLTTTTPRATPHVESVEGARAEVLSHGLVARSPEALREWQRRTAGRVAFLAMAGAPEPLAVDVRAVRQLAPFDAHALPSGRDDDPASWPQRYTLTELDLSFQLPNPYGGAPLSRRAHGFLARPATPPPENGYPVLLALNGHGGSARQLFDPGDAIFWYGDGFARRGFVVLGLDVSHRPIAERAELYGDLPDGDDPAAGNAAHPSIRAPGLDSDWSEDGERTWDALRGLDYLLSVPDVDPRSVTVVGLSMGAAVAQMAAALDPRVTAVVAAGESPELGALLAIGAHPCWRWSHGDVREYVDFSDYLALIAPRLLVVESGDDDSACSWLHPPTTDAKEVLRRARSAYAGSEDRLLHAIFAGRHELRFGDRNPTDDSAGGLGLPRLLAPPPDDLWSSAWVQDTVTVPLGRGLVDVLLGAQ
jgi:dienelactone hydrolase